MEYPNLSNLKNQLIEKGFVAIPDFLPQSDLLSFKSLFSSLDLGPGDRSRNLRHELLLKLSYHPFILDLCQNFFCEAALPMQSLSFKYPTTQSFHQDTVHFSTLPVDLMIACWIPLEDVSAKNGTLMYIPYSHLLPTFSKYEFPLVRRSRSSDSLSDQNKSYLLYESQIASAVSKLGLRVEYLSCKAGTAFIWHPRLWHGGCLPLDPNKTRYSYVTHYEAISSPIYLKHFSGMPFFPRLQNPRDLASRKPFLKYGPFSFLHRILRILTSYS